MTLTSKQRAELRAEAHHLKPVVHVGHQGLTPALIASLDDALRTMELVKVQLARTVDEKPKAAAAVLAEATSSEIVQVIGRKATLYRENPELERKKGELPWRR
jgi:RNA-binding protein